MSGLPYAKWYPTDWMNDPALRRCSYAARGLWMDMLCLMFQDEGYLSVNGSPLSPKDVAKLTGSRPDRVAKLTEELEKAGVFSRADDGRIYSRRIVRDIAKGRMDQENGRKGGNPAIKKTVNPHPNPPNNGGDKVARAKPESESELERSQSDAHTRATDRLDTKLLEKVVALFGRDTAKLGRIISGASTARAGPEAYLNGVLERETGPIAVTSSGTRKQVWVAVGSPAWDAWHQVEPKLAHETRWHPGERGTYRDSEYPPIREVRA